MSAVETTIRPARRALRLRTRRPRLSIIIGVCMLGAMLLASFIVPATAAYSPDDLVGAPLSAPSAAHPFGTDTYGRDVLVRVFAAAKVDYLIVLCGVTFSLVLGTAVGTLAAMARHGIWATLLMRVTDALIAVPFAMLILLIVISVGSERELLGLPKGVPSVLLAIGISGWAIYARLARAEAMSLRQRDFITATRLMGFSRSRALRRHVLPSVVATTGTFAVSDAILVIAVVASLPFLGAGVLPPTPEWGSMMFEGRSVIETAWWVVVFPGAALILTGIAVALLADGLLDRRERLDLDAG